MPTPHRESTATTGYAMVRGWAWRTWSLTFLLLAIATTLAASPSGAQGDQALDVRGDWASGFHAPGMDDAVLALASYDGAIVAAGRFTVAGGRECLHIARWDEPFWVPLGPGLNGTVTALAVWRGQLVAAGSFTLAGEVPAQHVALWDGAAWRPLGDGLDLEAVALAVHADALIAGGRFGAGAGGIPGGVARWDGKTWEALDPTGTQGEITALAVYDDKLIAAGQRASAVDDKVYTVARWNGGGWEVLADDIDRPVEAFSVVDRVLAAGGAFSRIEGIAARAVAIWNGRRWQPAGDGLRDFAGTFPTTRAFAVHQGKLVAAGSFTDPTATPPNSVVTWDGRSWRRIGRGMDGGAAVHALLEHAGGLVAGGSFSDADGHVVNGIAAFDDGAWQPLGSGAGFDAAVQVLTFFDDELIAGGEFTRAGAAQATGVARFDGRAWHAIGAGLHGAVLALAQYRGELVAAGAFAGANVARWTGSVWEPLGFGLDGPVRDLAVLGDFLYAAGRFSGSGNDAMPHLARWDGSTWSSMRVSLDVTIGHPELNALAVYAGTLVVGGRFEHLNHLGIQNVAVWDNGIWYGLRRGVDEVVEDLVVHAGRLFVAGFFNYADQMFAPQVASWNGTSWLPAGTGLRFDEPFVPDAVLHLHSFGNHLILGGRFDGIDDVRAHNLARWDGAQWRPLGAGTDAPAVAFASDQARLFVGGNFVQAGGFPSSFVARWDSDPAPRILSFAAQIEEAAVVLRWNVDGEVLARTRAVRVLRTEAEGAPGVELPGSPLRPETSMSYADHALTAGASYWYRLALVRPDGTERAEQAYRVDVGLLYRTTLRQPVVRSAREVSFAYTVGRSMHVELRLIDVRGRLLATLVDAPHTPGDYTVAWTGTTRAGARLARGVYLVHLQSDTQNATRKLVFVHD